MKHITKHGSKKPTTKDLDLFQLGWCESNKTLYINDNGEIRSVTATQVLEDNTSIVMSGRSLNKNETYLSNVVTSDELNIKISFDISTNVLNLQIKSLNGKNISLKNAIGYKEYSNNSNILVGETTFIDDMELESLDIDLISFDGVINKNFFCESFFYVNGSNYKIELRCADESSTSASIILSISKTVA